MDKLCFRHIDIYITMHTFRAGRLGGGQSGFSHNVHGNFRLLCNTLCFWRSEACLMPWKTFFSPIVRRQSMERAQALYHVLADALGIRGFWAMTSALPLAMVKRTNMWSSALVSFGRKIPLEKEKLPTFSAGSKRPWAS